MMPELRIHASCAERRKAVLTLDSDKYYHAANKHVLTLRTSVTASLVTCILLIHS